MKRFRLILIMAMLISVMAVVSFGVYTNLKDPTGIVNQVVFNRGDDNVFIEIKSKYEGPELEEGISPTYEYKLSRDDAGAYSRQNVIPTWELGATNFTTKETEISFTFIFKNINGAGNSLIVNVSDFAYDDGESQKFSVSYLTANDEDSLESAEETVIRSSNETIGFMLRDGQEIAVKLVYKLVRFDKKFELNNNIKVTFTNESST